MLPQIDVGGGDDAHVHLHFVHAAQVHELPVLQHAQDLALRVHAHGADFVEEQRAAVGDFKQAFLGRDGAGERALHVTEQRGFQQVRRHRAGIDRDEGPVAPRRIQVDRLGDQFFAGAALALQQNGGAAGRDLRHQVENPQHGLALADDVFEVVALLQRALELDVLFFRSMPRDGGAHVGQQLFVVPGLLDEVRGARLHGLAPRFPPCRRR